MRKKGLFVNGFICLKLDEQTSTTKKGVAGRQKMSDEQVDKMNEMSQESTVVPNTFLWRPIYEECIRKLSATEITEVQLILDL
ncbi:hypothetical protein J6590_080423 [Homalodisca vitripennis]|nr:hypothetical protein J6590_080423 [Homalodisca vitripennis]